MPTGVSVFGLHAAFESIVANRNTAQKHVWRARTILLTDGLGTMAIMAGRGKSKATVAGSWQQRYDEAGVHGVLADKTRLPGKPPIAEAKVGEVLRLTPQQRPHSHMCHL